MQQLVTSMAMLMCVLCSIASADTASDGRFLECKSKNVWDAGYVLSFDVSSYQKGQDAQIAAHLFELVPLWRKNLIYSGVLEQVRTGDEFCQFELVDRIMEPTSRISFKSSPNGMMIRLEELGGKRIDRWGELECQSEVVEVLTGYCREMGTSIN